MSIPLLQVYHMDSIKCNDNETDTNLETLDYVIFHTLPKGKQVKHKYA